MLPDNCFGAGLKPQPCSVDKACLPSKDHIQQSGIQAPTRWSNATTHICCDLPFSSEATPRTFPCKPGIHIWETVTKTEGEISIERGVAINTLQHTTYLLRGLDKHCYVYFRLLFFFNTFADAHICEGQRTTSSMNCPLLSTLSQIGSLTGTH